MITRTPDLLREEAWADALRNGYRTPLALLDALGLSPAAVGMSAAAASAFPFRVTRAYADRMRRRDPHDPLLLQVLPVAREMADQVGYSDDPVGEFGLGADSALLRKYHGRGLLLLTAACAINCRYCFRRAYPYGEHGGGKALERGIASIAADPSISEVILSGGDPLMLDDARLAALFERLAAIPHVERLRVHSRLPIVLPQRLTPHLLGLLTPDRFSTTLVVHANHPQELDQPTLSSLRQARDLGIVTLNQSVLLKGVNDDVETLARLSERLFSSGVLPYYLHELDRVSGTAHFAVSRPRALALAAGLRARLPGYLVPRVVREEAGATGKTPLECGRQTTHPA